MNKLVLAAYERLEIKVKERIEYRPDLEAFLCLIASDFNDGSYAKIKEDIINRIGVGETFWNYCDDNGLLSTSDYCKISIQESNVARLTFISEMKNKYKD